MELGLSLGEAPAKGPEPWVAEKRPRRGFSMELGLGIGRRGEDEAEEAAAEREERGCSGGDPPPMQLELLPLVPVPRSQHSHHMGFPWPPENRTTRGFDVNRAPAAEDVGEEAATVGSPPSPNNSNSPVSSFQMDFGAPQGCGGNGGAPGGGDSERASSRASDEEENGSARKKLRLSKEQSAFLEESFKEHNTLNPKQKLALAKQLNLRPRQVEVWFQNRRARTKLKQTEVDCEYLKRCCETLTEENRRLHKELAELRALKATAAHPLSHLPATTLSMCPSCERITSSTAPAPSSAATTTTTHTAAAQRPAAPFSAIFSRPRFFPFAAHPAPPHQPSAAS